MTEISSDAGGGWDHDDDEAMPDRSAPPGRALDDDEPSEEELRALGQEGDEEEEEDPRKKRQQQEQQRDERTPDQIRADNLHRALKQTRTRLRETREAQQAQAQRMQIMATRQEAFLQRIAEANGIDIADLMGQQREPTPDEPIELIKHEMQKLVQPLYQKLEEQTQQQIEERAAQHAAAIDQYHAADLQAFEAEHPDYSEAEDFMLEQIAAGAWQATAQARPDWDEDEIAAHVERQLKYAIANVGIDMAHQGRSLARETYEHALARGWRPGGGRQEQRGDGAPRRPRGPRTAALARNLERQPAHAAGGERAPRAGELSLERLADMDVDSFEEITSKPGAWKKLMGSLP